jgi:hypothetical protein
MLVEGAAAQRRQVLAGRVVQAQLALGLGVGAEGGGEQLADRAQLEQRVLVHGLAAVAGGDAIVEEVALALVHDGHGQAGNPVLLDGRLHGGIDGGAQLRRAVLLARAVWPISSRARAVMVSRMSLPSVHRWQPARHRGFLDDGGVGLGIDVDAVQQFIELLHGTHVQAGDEG